MFTDMCLFCLFMSTYFNPVPFTDVDCVTVISLRSDSDYNKELTHCAYLQENLNILLCKK